jgi:ADP-heptose:LPS heptosyltransferase
MPDTRILVIKLSAFGNIILSLGAFAAIRRHHGDAAITLLTTPPYAAWLSDAPYFDRVMVEDRARWWDLPALWRLRRSLARGGFTRVYDLQTSGRSSRYFRIFPRSVRPEWSGIATGCSHPDRDPDRDALHDMDRQAGQLRQAGVPGVPEPDLSWCHGAIDRFRLPDAFALLVPGSSDHRPRKRWPVAHYAALAEQLRHAGLTPVVIGTGRERPLAAAIPAAIDLTGQTTPGDLCDLARAARFAVGNDTGPIHLTATIGCPTIVLFSHDSDPALCAPRGRSVRVLRRPDLDDLAVADVAAVLPI